MSDIKTLTARKRKLSTDAAKLLEQADAIQAQIVAIERGQKADQFIGKFGSDLTADQAKRMKSVLLEGVPAEGDAGANATGGN